MNCNKDEIKKFCGVKFLDKTHEVVPKTWLVFKPKKLMCFWPSEEDKVFIRNAAKTCSSPDFKVWKLHPVKLLTHSKSFIGCEKKLYEPESYETASSTDYLPSDDESALESSTFLPRCNAMPPVKSRSTCASSSSVLALRPGSSVAEPSLASLENDVKTMKRDIAENSKKLDAILTVLHKEQLNRAAEAEASRTLIRTLGQPAVTEDELGALLCSPNISAVLRDQVGKNSMDTTRRIIRRIMSKSLASIYSLTGLGASRKPTKRCFREHPASKLCFDAVKEAHPQLSYKEYCTNVAAVFRSVPDWDGGRPRRPALRPDNGADSEDVMEVDAVGSGDDDQNSA